MGVSGSRPSCSVSSGPTPSCLPGESEPTRIPKGRPGNSRSDHSNRLPPDVWRKGQVTVGVDGFPGWSKTGTDRCRTKSAQPRCDGLLRPPPSPLRPHPPSPTLSISHFFLTSAPAILGGEKPASMVKRTAADDHTSAALPSYLDPSKTLARAEHTDRRVGRAVGIVLLRSIT